jgi:hypothetical protein
MLEINTRTNQYADYFLPSTIKLWNNLPLTLRKTESLSTNVYLKKTLKSKCQSSYLLLHIGLNELGKYYMRVFEHLFLRNLVDSPNCLVGWGGVDTTSHYILHCSRFADIKQALIVSISNIPVNITINLLLFGTNELTDEQNTLIVVSIQKYIVKIKRFTPWSYGLPYFSDVHLASKLIISYHCSLLSIHY